jgi:hypothetical protein
MTFGTARDLSSQVVAIRMTSFWMLINFGNSEAIVNGHLEEKSAFRTSASRRRLRFPRPSHSSEANVTES